MGVGHTSRVNRWCPETDQAARWLAAGLLTAEEGFQRLSHYTDLPLLLEHLQTRRDCENLKALKWRLPDWLQEEGKQVEDMNRPGIAGDFNS